MPKPFAEIGGSALEDATSITLVGRQIDLLKEAGVAEIAVVVGYEQAKARAKLRGSGVIIVENTASDLAASGTAHSFQFAVRSLFNPLDGRTPCLLMDGDLVYERTVLRTIVESNVGSSLLVSPRAGGDAEEVRVYGCAGRPRLMGKNLLPPVIDGLDLLGEATGIIRFDPADHALVRELLDTLLGASTVSGRFGSLGIACEHEDLCQHLIDMGRLRAISFDPDVLFHEVDFQEDLEHVRREMYPQILRKESR